MPWDSTVLANAQFDFVEVHWYGASPPNVALTDTALLSAGVSYFTSALQQLRSELVAAGKANTPIYIGEWGIPGANGDSPQDITVVGALYTVPVLGEMTKAGIRMAGVWEGFDSGPCVLTPPVSGIDSAQSWYTPSLFEAIAGGTNPACPAVTQPPIGTAFPRAVAINMVQQAFNAGDTVFAPVLGDSLSSIATVRAYGARRGSGYGLLLVNTDKSTVFTTPIVIANDSRTFSATSLVYDQAIYENSISNNWAGPVASPLGTVSGSFSVTLLSLEHYGDYPVGYSISACVASDVMQ
jgi:hypothetical protein